MNKITDFQHPENSSFVGWVHSGLVIKKDFTFKIVAILLKGEEKVLVIELKKDKNNAVIYKADGNVFRRISNPDKKAICFGDAYYINDELTLISRRSDASMMAVVINERGEPERVYETR